MRLKSFQANTIREAMEMVKEALGEEAVIIATKEDKAGGVRVTAAIEEDLAEMEQFAEPADRQSRPLAPSGDWLHEDGNDDAGEAVIEDLTESLIKHGVPADVTDHIISCATVMGEADPHTALTAALEHLFAYRPLPHKAYKKPIMLVGAPGTGKTLAAAKIAARGVMNGLHVHLISTDTIRAGGVEQLSAFTKILQTPLARAEDANALKQAIKKAGSCDQIIIDTAGMSPFDPNDMRELAKLMSVAKVDPLLVMPAGGDATESGEIARVFATLGVRWILPSRLDIARRLGGLLEAAHQGGLSFADASSNAQIADGLMRISPTRIADFMIPRQKKTEKVNKSLTPPRQAGQNRRL